MGDFKGIDSDEFRGLWNEAYREYPVALSPKPKGASKKVEEKQKSYWLELREPRPGIRLIGVQLQKDVTPFVLSLRCWFYEEFNESYAKLAAADTFRFGAKSAEKFLDQPPTGSWKSNLDQQDIHVKGIRYSLSIQEQLETGNDTSSFLRSVVEDFCLFVLNGIGGASQQRLGVGDPLFADIERPGPHLKNWEKELAALVTLGGRATISEIHSQLLIEDPRFERENVRKDMCMLSINDEGRFAYRAWEKRHGISNPDLDKVFYVDGIGADRLYEVYSPDTHGVWEAYREDGGKLQLRRRGGTDSTGMTVPPPSAKQKVAGYKAKLPAMRAWLIRVAQARGIVTYGQMMEAFGVDRFSLRHAMDFLGNQARDLNEPVLTALIVNKGTGRCSGGLEKEFSIVNDIAEREALYERWSVIDPPVLTGSSTDLVEVKAARFASVESRPEQAAFRRRLFLAYNGRCIVSGCDVENALDAAHKQGRNWRLGHNQVEDGYLMRKDLHALYDCGLLTIDEQGKISFRFDQSDHYNQFLGVTAAVLTANGTLTTGI